MSPVGSLVLARTERVRSDQLPSRGRSPLRRLPSAALSGGRPARGTSRRAGEPPDPISRRGSYDAPSIPRGGRRCARIACLLMPPPSVYLHPLPQETLIIGRFSLSPRAYGRKILLLPVNNRAACGFHSVPVFGVAGASGHCGPVISRPGCPRGADRADYHLILTAGGSGTRGRTGCSRDAPPGHAAAG